MPPKTARFLSLACLSVTAALVLSAPVRSQSLSVPDEELQPAGQDDLRPLTQDGSLLSMQGGQRLMNEASAAVNAQNYELAVSKLQDARQVYNQLSNFYQQLAASFSGIDNRITEGQREQALQAAQMRDQATYQLALVHRAQNRPELAVPLLVQIIRSQQPTRDLGQQAYRQLYELGFVDSPFPRDSGSTSSAPAPATSSAPIQSSQPLN